MEKLSSKQQLRYTKFFNKKLAEMRDNYIQAVLRGEKKMNATVLNPIEIWHAYDTQDFRRSDVEYNASLEALWSMLPDRTSGNGKTLVIRDGSSSMLSPIGRSSKATMLDAASAMTVYCAQSLTGAFKDKFITFSSKPKMLDMSDCKTLADKMNLLHHYGDITNTNLMAVFDLVLSVAVEHHLSQDEIPAYLMILSDMEFDFAVSMRSCYQYGVEYEKTALFDIIREKWEQAGYEIPTLIFWQLNGRRTIYPEVDSKNGIIYLSGFSTTELELVMAGKFERFTEKNGKKETEIISPLEQLEMKLSDPRYDAVEEAILRGLLREQA